MFFFFFSSRRRHTRFDCDWSSDVCSSDLRGGKPVEHFTDGVGGLVRVTILILEPGSTFFRTEPRLSEIWVEPLSAAAGQSKQTATQTVHDATVLVVEAHDDVPAGFEERQQPFETAARVAGVMQDAVTENHVELRGLEARLEEVHLREPNPGETMLAAEPFGKAERIEAHVRANHATARDAQKIAQLSSAAADLEHGAVERQRSIQLVSVRAATRFLDETPQRIVLVVVR